MGDYICIARKDWDTGLPMIAKGADMSFGILAEKDLQCPDDRSRDQYVMAEAWWAWAEKTTDPDRRAGYRTRAAFWYRRALPELDGLDKATAQQAHCHRVSTAVAGNQDPAPAGCHAVQHAPVSREHRGGDVG
jgi:hypothetical protein